MLLYPKLLLQAYLNPFMHNEFKRMHGLMLAPSGKAAVPRRKQIK
jgi:hypothetical protein